MVMDFEWDIATGAVGPDYQQPDQMADPFYAPTQDASAVATAEPIYEPEPVAEQMAYYDQQPVYEAQGQAYAEPMYYEPAPAPEYVQEPDYQAYDPYPAQYDFPAAPAYAESPETSFLLEGQASHPDEGGGGWGGRVSEYEPYGGPVAEYEIMLDALQTGNNVAQAVEIAQSHIAGHNSIINDPNVDPATRQLYIERNLGFEDVIARLTGQPTRADSYQDSQLVDPMAYNYGQSQKYPGLDYVQEAQLDQSIANIQAQFDAGMIDADTANANFAAAYAQISGQAAAAERDLLRYESERDTGVEYPNLRAQMQAEGIGGSFNLAPLGSIAQTAYEAAQRIPIPSLSRGGGPSDIGELGEISTPYREEISGALGNVGRGMGGQFANLVDPFGVLGVRPVAQDVGQFIGESTYPQNLFQAGLAAGFGGAGFAAGRGAGEGVLRSLGRGALEAFALDPTSPGGVRAADNVLQALPPGAPGMMQRTAMTEGFLGNVPTGGGAIPPTGAGGPEDMRSLFESARGAATDSYIDSAWQRIVEGKGVLFGDRPGTLESRIQQALDAGAIQSRDDVARVVKGEEYILPSSAAPTSGGADLSDIKIGAVREWDDSWNASEATQAFKESLSPAERTEYAELYATVRAGSLAAPDNELRGWTALMDELQVTPYQVARGEMSVTEGMAVNRLLFNTHMTALTDDMVTTLKLSPEFEALRPETRAFAMEALSRREAAIAADLSTPEAAARSADTLVSNSGFRAARTEALRQADAVPNTSAAIPDWVAARLRGEAADIPREAREQLLFEANRLGVEADPQLALRGSTQAVEEILHKVEIAREAERRLNIGNMGRATEDYFAELKGEAAKIEAQANLAKQRAWASMGAKNPALGGTPQALFPETGGVRPRSQGATSGPYKVWTQFNENRGARRAAGQRGPTQRSAITGGPQRLTAMPAGANPSPSSLRVIDAIIDAVNSVAFFPFGFDLSHILRQLSGFALNPFYAPARAATRASLEASLKGLTLPPAEAERFLKSLLDNSIAVNTKGVGFELAGKGIAEREAPGFTSLTRKLPGVERFENAFNLGPNAARIAATDAAVRLNPNMTPAQAQTLANFFTRWSGRGSFGPADKVAARALGPLFTSLRFMASFPERAAYLLPVTRLADGSVEMFGPVWREAVKSHAGYFATLGAVLYALDQAGVEVGWDPRSWGNFLGFNAGDEKNPQWIDLSGGWKAYGSLLVTALSGQRIQGDTLRTNYPAVLGRDEDGRWEGALGEFLRNRIGPAIQGGLRVGQEAGWDTPESRFLRPDRFNNGVFGLSGNVGTPLDQALQFVIPLWVQDVAEAIRAAPEGKGALRGLVAGIGGFFGAGVSSYEVSAAGGRAIDRQGVIDAMIASGELSGIEKGTPYSALHPDEKGRVNARWAEENPEGASEIAEAARQRNDIFQAARDYREAGDTVKATALDTLWAMVERGEISPYDAKGLLQDIRSSYRLAVDAAYESPEYKRTVEELERSDATRRQPSGFFDDIGKQLRGEEPGQPLPTPGVISDLVATYYKIPESFKFTDEKGVERIDWDAARQSQAQFIDGVGGIDEAAASRLKGIVEPGTAHSYEQFYFNGLTINNMYYDLVPEGAPDTSQTWFTYQLPWLIAHPDYEAVMFLLGSRRTVATQEAADIVHQLAPGQNVTVKTY